MLQRFERRINSPARVGSPRRLAVLVTAVSALAFGMAALSPSASAVTQVGGQGWFAWGGDYSVSLPFVSGATYTAGSNPWNPQAITDFSTYNTIRLKDWACCDNNENVAWSDRKLPTNTDQSGPYNAGEWVWTPPNNWSDTGTPPAKGQGMAYEWQVDLCNRTNTNMWISLPYKANDDFVTKVAQLILYGSDGTNPYTSVQGNPTWKPLNSNLKVYIEYSNEVWNYTYDQEHWCEQQGIAQGLGDHLHYYGRRVKQVDTDFYNVWTGSTGRLVRVLGAQCVNNTWVEDNEIAQVTADGGTVDALAVAPYWDVGDGADPNYFTNATNAINTQIANIAVHKTWANSHGVSLVCYEGGMGCETNADQARRNSNNYALYQTFLSDLNSNGVSLIMLYAHVGAVSTGNAWGMKEYWDQATSASPSWNGVTTWINNNPGSGHGAGGGGIPSPPSGLTASSGNTQVTLNWNSSSGATSYNVYRGTSSGGESGTAIATGITPTSYTNTGLTNGTTYFYTVKAVNGSGTSGTSNEASGTPTSGDTSGPVKINAGGPAVSPFVADADFSGGTVATNWTGTIDTSAVTNPAPQAVYQSERYGSPLTYTMGGLTANTNYTVRLHFCENYWSASGQRTFNVAINGTTVLTNFDIFATAGAQHKANIQQFTEASNGSGQIIIAFTNVVDHALINGIEVNTVSGPPPAPTGLMAGPGSGQVALSWTAASGATSYNVYRGTVSGGESGTAIATGIATTSYTNTGLTGGTTYYFTVKAVNSGGTSGASNEVSAIPNGSTSGTVQVNCGGPAVGAFVGDTDFTGGTPYTNWTGTIDTSAVTSPAPQAVYQSERYGSPLTYTMGGLTPSTNYTVRLHFCENYWSASGQRTFNVSINSTQVLTNFDIYATTGAQHKANIQQFTEAANSSGQIVIAFTNVVDHALINGIEVNAISGPPPAPTGLTATPGNTQVALSWTASSGATAYDVKRSTVSGSGYVTVSSPTTTSYTNTGLTNGTTYYFVVDAKNTGGTSGNSNQASATPIDPNVHTGTWAAKCVFSGTPTYKNMDQTVNVVSNSSYSASFWFKGTGSATLRIFAGSWGTLLSTTSFTATSSWQQCSASFNTGSNTQITYNIEDTSSVAGTGYVDDCFMGVLNGTNVLSNPGYESGNTGWAIDTGSPFSIVQNP